MDSESKKLDVNFDSGILYITIATAHRDTLNQLPAKILAVVPSLDFSQPLLLFTDHSTGVISPYLKHVLQNIYDQLPPHIYGRSAVLVPPTIVGESLKTIGNRFVKQNLPRLERRFFTHKPEALTWLQGARQGG